MAGIWLYTIFVLMKNEQVYGAVAGDRIIEKWHIAFHMHRGNLE